MLDIQKYSYTTSQDEQLVCGLHASFRGDKLHVNLFDLKENIAGAKIADNLFGLTSDIAPKLFGGYATRAEARWSVTTGYRTSTVSFDDLYDKPMGVIVSDETALAWEQYQPFSLERYRQDYLLDHTDRPIHESDLLPSDEPVYPKQRKKVFAVPCESAADGVFYMQPEMWGTDLEQDYVFFLANTKDLIERIRHDDPDMIGHMHWKFLGTDVTRLLEHNTFDNPTKANGFAFGEWIKDDIAVNPGAKLTIATGNAGMVPLASALDLPFFPVQVEKEGFDEDTFVRASWIETVRSEIGYRP